jgi:hypothetical protein
MAPAGAPLQVRAATAAGNGAPRRVPIAEGWRRFDEAVPTLRVAVNQEPDPPPLWIGSWGSPAGLRAATLDDGWMASAYNTTPDTPH